MRPLGWKLMLGSVIVTLLLAGGGWITFSNMRALHENRAAADTAAAERQYRLAVTGEIATTLAGLLTLWALIASAARHFTAQTAAATAMRAAEKASTALLAGQQVWSERLQHVAAAALTINSSDTQESVIAVIAGEARQLLGARDCDVHFETTIPEEIDGSLVVPFHGRNGAPLGYIHCRNKNAGAFTTDDRAILSQLAHMGAIAIQNSRLYDALRQGDVRKDEFLAILAHELRNPLAPIRHSLELMRITQDPERHFESRAVIDRQLSQLVHLVDDLLDVSRISLDKLELRSEGLTLAEVLNSAIEISRPLIEKQHHQLRVTLPSAPIHVHGDMTRLAQVFSNLLNNASKYTEPGGTISITAEETAGRAIVSIQDSGAGIAGQALPHIFEMFAQVIDLKGRAPGGLGVGLALARRLTELHGGTLTASSAGLGHGSEFVVDLPAAAAGALAVAPLPAAPSATRPLRLLVVDDNVDSADGLALLLRMSGHRVDIARDGHDAIARARATRPDLILLDIGLPGLSGYEVAQQLRADATTPRPVIVALTGWGQEADRRRARDAGFDHHLVKPVDFEALHELLRSVRPATG